MAKKKSKTKPEKVDNIKVNVNEFGEITTNINLEKINNFLNENVEDKKLNEKKNKDKER